MLGKRLLQSLPKTSTLTHNPNPPIKQLKTAHARSIDREKNYAPGTAMAHATGILDKIISRLHLTICNVIAPIPGCHIIMINVACTRAVLGCVRHLQHLASHHLHTHANKHLQIAPQHLLALHIMQHPSTHNQPP